MFSIAWLAEHRSVITTLSSLLLVTGFLIIAARGRKSKQTSHANSTLAEQELSVGQTEPGVSAADESNADIVPLLPELSSEDMSAPSSTRPNLFILPFEVSTANDQEQCAAVEMHDDIVAILSRSADIAIIGRMAQEGLPASVNGRSIRTIGQELDVRYAATGNLRRFSDGWRLSMQLLETTNGSSIWAKTFEPAASGDADGNILLNRIAGYLTSEVLRAEAVRTLRQAPERLSAQDLARRASHSFGAFNRRTFHEIESLTRLAIDLEPNFPGGYGVLAGALALKAHQAWTEAPQEDLKEAFSLGGRGIELAPADPRMLYWWGHVHFYGGRAEDAIGILANATAKDTSFAPAYILHGAALILTQQPTNGIVKIDHALDLAPDHPLAFQAHLWRGIGQMERRDTDAAEKAFLKSINGNVIKNPADSAAAFWAWIGIACVYAEQGRKVEIKAILDRLCDCFPGGDYRVMIEHAEASFTPGLGVKRLKVTSIADRFVEPPAEPQVFSLRNLFHRRAPVETSQS